MTATATRLPALARLVASGLVLVLGVGLGLVGAHALRRHPATDPSDVVRAYVHAAERGDARALLRMTAPSQRAAMHGSPLPYQSTSIAPRRALIVERARLTPLSVDKATVTVSGDVCLRPSGRCGELAGAAGSGEVLVVRESSQWWVTARPFVLHPARPKTTSVSAHVESRLVLSGGLNVQLTDSDEVPDHHCASLGWRAFEFNPLSADHPIEVLVPPSSTTLRPGTSRWPADAFSIEPMDTVLSFEWVPAAPVNVTVAADGRSGSLAIRDWVPHAVFDDDAARGQRPLNGELTFTCRDS